MNLRQLREKTLTPAEKKKREEIAKAIEKDDPDMPMDKKMAIATATAKRVAERVRDGKVDPTSKMGKGKLTGQEVSAYYRSNPSAKKAASDATVKKAIELALDTGGNMSYAEKEIDKLRRGLSRHPEVKKALRYANESVQEAVDSTDTGGSEEVSMATRQIKAMRHFLDGIEARVKKEGDMEEWFQNKLTKANDYLKTLYSYGHGDEVKEAVSPAQQAAIAISKKERGEKPKNECADEKDFKPHMMYDPKTGKGYKANTYADHVKMDKMGYTHEKPEVKEEKNCGCGQTPCKTYGTVKEDYRKLAKHGMGAETMNSIRVGHGVDYYRADGAKYSGKIVKMGPKSYIVRDDKNGKNYQYMYLDREKAKKYLKQDMSEAVLNEITLARKDFDKIKKGDKITVHFDSSMKKGHKQTLVVKSKTRSNKYNVDKVNMVDANDSRNRTKFTFYSRGGKDATLAWGNSAVSLTKYILEYGGPPISRKKYLKDIREKKDDYPLYHKTYSGAMAAAYAYAKKKGFEVDTDDIDRKVATGPKKPSNGKTNSFTLKLKGQNRKMLAVQVTNLDNKRYELNTYIT